MQLRLRLAKERFLGDIEGEGLTLRRLRAALLAVGDTAAVREAAAAIGWLHDLQTGGTGVPATEIAPDERIATLLATGKHWLEAGLVDSALVALDDAQEELEKHKGAANLTALGGEVLGARALALQRNGQVESAIELLLEGERRLTQQLVLTNDVAPMVARVLLLADLAGLYHRALAKPDLLRATAYYDTASTAMLNALAMPLRDEERTVLSDRVADLHADWALAWLGRESFFGESARSALGAIEEGRVRALQLMRGAECERDVSGAFPSLGDKVGEYIGTHVGPGEVLLDYALARDTLLIWIISGGRTQVVRRGVDLQATESDVAAVRAGMRPRADAPVAPSAAGRRTPSSERGVLVGVEPATAAEPALNRLYDVLFPGPVEAAMADSQLLLIVPDRVLNELPFAALRSDSTRAPLGATHPLRFAPGIAILGDAVESAFPTALRPCSDITSPERCAPTLSRGSTNAAGWKARRLNWSQHSLVVGDPRMPHVRLPGGDTPTLLDSLPGARAEALEIAALLGVRPLIDSAATEGAVRRAMAQAPVIHLATHGLAYSDSHLARRSFVVLAADATNDGLLEAREIADDSTLTLRAELVVLSACETALGALSRTEGTIGLQRAFLARGARSLLVSQWKVPDAASRLLMTAFYRAWLDPARDTDKAAALREAQVEVRKVYRDPYYWAGFQLIGAP